MNVYPLNLFETWPGDTTTEQLPTGPRVERLFRGLYDHTCSELQWLSSTVKYIKQQDDQDAFDQLYRRSHILYGFTSILGLPKVVHLLALLDFTFDYARHLESFERHSMDYVVQLLIDTTQAVFDDLHAAGHSGRELTDVIDECETYLYEPFQQCLASPPPPPPEPAPSEVADEVAETQSEVQPVAVAVDLDGDDEPEALDIPIDKVGLVSDFCEECRDSLGQIGYRLVELEDSDDPMPLVNDLFRSVHTVKGGARLMQIRKMETLTHQLESLLDQVRNGTRSVNADLIDVLLDGKKLLDDMVDEVASRGPIRTRIGPVLQVLVALQNGTTPQLPGQPTALQPTAKLPKPVAAAVGSAGHAVPTETKPRAAPSAESIRIPTEKLDDVLNTASEIFITRIRLQKDVAEITSAIHQFNQTLQQMSDLDTRVMLNRLAEANRRLSNDLRVVMARPNGHLAPERLNAMVYRFHGELTAELERQGYSSLEEITLNLLSIEEIRKRLQKNVEHLEQLSGRLQTGAMNFRMVPIAHLFDRFPTQVRDMGRQVSKKVKLDVSGGDTELDKVLINQLTDPLLHILRNAVDHGIESPEERQAVGKSDTGRITLRAYYYGSNAVIEVGDDGRGIRADKVLARAIERELIEEERAKSLTNQEIFEFIFEPGFSTATQVSTLSGRGVGMDVVKTAISQVQGSITIDSVPNQGTTIRMKLPLTLAVVGILLVEERFNQFAFPILHVEEILTIAKSDIKQISGNIVYNHREHTLPITTLSSILNCPPSVFVDEKLSLVILAEGEKKLGVLVDRVLGRQEVLIKNLGSLIKKVPFVMGCTILSDSRLVLILNVWEMVNARTEQPMLASLEDAEDIRSVRQQCTVLIVDDSAIQRKNLSAILCHAGYRVETADNGFAGLKCIQQRHYAAFCVDVVMPLMDGFEFVERARRIPGYQHTPVFCITSYTGQQERGRAASLGVNAFLAKPIDANLLVETMDRDCLPAASVGMDSAALRDVTRA